ncbi:MAG: phage minor head protein [Kiritimatiellia bacterium]
MTGKLTIQTYPNETAAAYIRGKAVADPANFGRLPEQLKQRAFTVAGIEQMDVLRRIRNAIAKLPEGASWDEARKEIAAEISPFVGSGDAKTDAKAAKLRADFLLRTHGFQAYAVSRHQQQMATVRSHPYWQYETVGDSRVRAGHAKLDGKVLRADDPWWKTHYPPWDWGCRCIVHALDEEDAQEIGISEHKDMPTPERSDSYRFDPSDASIDLDSLREGYDEADWRLFAAKCRSATVQADGRERATMWELMVDRKAEKLSRALADATARDGNERAVALDFDTGKTLARAVGDAGGVRIDVPDGKNVATLHTHPNGDNTPSPADLLFGFNTLSKAEYVASGRKLRRWTWLKTPEPEDARLMVEFDKANKNGGVDIEAYKAFLFRLAKDGYIRMEILT